MLAEISASEKEAGEAVRAAEKAAHGLLAKAKESRVRASAVLQELNARRDAENKEFSQALLDVSRQKSEEF